MAHDSPRWVKDLILCLCAAVLCAVFAADSRAAQLNWVGLGDSYSAGIGGRASGEGVCGRDEEAAYSAQARQLLEARGMAFSSYILAACGAATTSDVISGQLATVGNANIVTITIGGNDV